MVEEAITTDVFLTGVLAMLIGASWLFKNWLAAIAWGFTVLVAVFVGAFNLSAEYFWLSLMGTGVILVAGLVVRVKA